MSQHTFSILKTNPFISILIKVVFVAKPLDVPDTSVQAPETASMVVHRGESGTVSSNQTELNLRFGLCHL